MSKNPTIKSLSDRIPFERAFSVPKPARICWGLKIHMPPDGGAGGPTFFGHLDAVYDQIAIASKPGASIEIGRNHTNDPKSMPSSTGFYDLTVNMYWCPDPNGSHDPSAMALVYHGQTPGVISPGNPMWRPLCLIIGGEDNPDAKPFFDGYHNILLYICYSPMPTPAGLVVAKVDSIFDRPAPHP